MTERRKDLIWRFTLFIVTLAVYVVNFRSALLSPNAFLSGSTEDALKNCYTFVYHVTHDTSFLHFAGMNHPFGEHVVYTDGQPLLALLMRCFPFLSPWLIAIMNWTIFLSFPIAAVILYNIFRMYNSDRAVSWLFSLAMTLLSPQYFKICLGHYALAMAFVVPLHCYLLLRWFLTRSGKVPFFLFALNCVWFLHHPYVGLMVSLFTFLCIGISAFTTASVARIRTIVLSVIAGLAPAVLFRVFLAVTDHHPNRAEVPYGADMWNLNWQGLLVPCYGPFSKPLASLFGGGPANFEAYLYPGVAVIGFAVVWLMLLPYTRKYLQPAPGILPLFIAATLLLLFSFGLHAAILKSVGVEIAAISQFRAAGRFAWFFYYTLPIVLVTSLRTFISAHNRLYALRVIAAVILTFNLFESYFYFRIDAPEHWRTRNIFAASQLTREERRQIQLIRQQGCRAIVPLPFFHGGTELYVRPGLAPSLRKALLFSYHTGLPLVSSFMSRSSLDESAAVINVVDEYRSNNRARRMMGNGWLAVIICDSLIFPDEQRMADVVDVYDRGDSATLGFVRASQLSYLQRRAVNALAVDSAEDAVYVRSSDARPFSPAKMNQLENIYVLDSNTVKAGEYVASLHLHVTDRRFESLGLNLIISESDAADYDWRYNFSLREPSSVYPGYVVAERKFRVLKGKRYEFLLQGFYDRAYTISDFLLRPITTDVRTPGGINNFPR